MRYFCPSRLLFCCQMWSQFYKLSINSSTNTSSWGHLKIIAVVNIFDCGIVDPLLDVYGVSHPSTRIDTML
jgi:hypothetical protein